MRSFIFPAGTIRQRLLLGFVLLSLLPSLGINAVSILVGYRNGREQAFERIESINSLGHSRILNYTQNIRGELSAALNEPLALERARIVLDLAGENVYYAFFSGAMRARFALRVAQSRWMHEIFLANPSGQVILSTQTGREGQVYHFPAFENGAMASGQAHLMFAVGEAGEVDVVAVLPVDGLDQHLAGYLVALADAGPLAEILAGETGLGETGKAYLSSRAGRFVAVADAAHGTYALSFESSLSLPAEIWRGLESQNPYAAIYSDFLGRQVLGVVRWNPDLELALAAEQDFADAFRSILSSLRVNILITVLSVTLAVLVSLVMTRSIADPIIKLASAAARIAGGDLNQTAVEEGGGEVGVLARAFNSMTAQLRDLINGLEQRVERRTVELQAANGLLEYKALQLETSAKISREATSILSVKELLERVAPLIRDAFNCSRVMIYLLDEKDGRMVLKAASPDRSPVGKEPAPLASLEIPLRVGEKSIGALMVEGSVAGEFSAEDARVIQNLGDQIAIALENARLYGRVRELAVIEERNRLARELHDSITQSLYSSWLITESNRRQSLGRGEDLAEQGFQKLAEINQQMLKEMRLLVYELRPLTLGNEGLLAALQRRIEAVEKRAGIDARLHAGNMGRLEPRLEEGLYWIAQEGLNNALKHSSAGRIDVFLSIEEQSVVLEVKDNGCGFDTRKSDQAGGMGLSILRDRARELGAVLNIESNPGEGTLVSVRAPISGSVRRAGESS